MNIQSNINQVLSIAGLLAGQTPMARYRAESYAEQQKLKKAQAGAEKASEAALQAIEGLPKGASETQVDTATELYEDFFGEAIAKERESVLLSPTDENVKQLTLSKEGLKEFKQSVAEENEEKARKAQQEEQNRLARSQILEGVYTGSAPRTAEDTEKIKIARGGY